MNTHSLTTCQWPKCSLLGDYGLFVEFHLGNGSKQRQRLAFCAQHYPQFTRLSQAARADIINAYLEEKEEIN